MLLLRGSERAARPVVREKLASTAKSQLHPSVLFFSPSFSAPAVVVLSAGDELPPDNEIFGHTFNHFEETESEVRKA